jgi:predicted DNA-binding transcriptional regulator AlpA
MDLDPFCRKSEALAFSRLRQTEFHEQLRDGRFPEPDAYLGPRMPVWLQSTLQRWQTAVLAKSKPVNGYGARKNA